MKRRIMPVYWSPFSSVNRMRFWFSNCVESKTSASFKSFSSRNCLRISPRSCTWKRRRNFLIYNPWNRQKQYICLKVSQFMREGWFYHYRIPNLFNSRHLFQYLWILSPPPPLPSPQNSLGRDSWVILHLVLVCGVCRRLLLLLRLFAHKKRMLRTFFFAAPHFICLPKERNVQMTSIL